MPSDLNPCRVEEKPDEMYVCTMLFVLQRLSKLEIPKIKEAQSVKLLLQRSERVLLKLLKLLKRSLNLPILLQYPGQYPHENSLLTGWTATWHVSKMWAKIPGR